MRKPAALFVAAFATVAGGGLAVAVEGGPDLPEAPPSPSAAEIRLAEDLETTTTEAPTTTTTEAPTTTTTESPASTTTIVVVPPVVDETDAAPAENHGGAVSAAAHECPREGHGQCVSEVARNRDAVAPHEDRAPEAPETPDEDDDADDDAAGGEGNGNGHRNGNGNGHGPGGNGNGRGHADD